LIDALENTAISLPLARQPRPCFMHALHLCSLEVSV
jgi:hypothetical protein